MLHPHRFDYTAKRNHSKKGEFDCNINYYLFHVIDFQ